MLTTATGLAFDGFRDHLDDYNDRRERLIKSSRDITALSKKVIFLLHRLVLDDTTNERTVAITAAKQGHEKLHEIQILLGAMATELEGDNFWRYQRQVSPGIQEYIEALSFAHYLERGTLITYEEVQATLKGKDSEFSFPLPVDDYLLGVSDLTGELMRLAISAIARRGGRAKANEVCTFVRACRADFERFSPLVRGLSKKQAVTQNSLEKIEQAAYAIAIRGSEYHDSPEMMDDIVAQAMAGTAIVEFSRRRDEADGPAGGGEE